MHTHVSSLACQQHTPVPLPTAHNPTSCTPPTWVLRGDLSEEGGRALPRLDIVPAADIAPAAPAVCCSVTIPPLLLLTVVSADHGVATDVMVVLAGSPGGTASGASAPWGDNSREVPSQQHSLLRAISRSLSACSAGVGGVGDSNQSMYAMTMVMPMEENSSAVTPIAHNTCTWRRSVYEYWQWVWTHCWPLHPRCKKRQ